MPAKIDLDSAHPPMPTDFITTSLKLLIEVSACGLCSSGSPNGRRLRGEAQGLGKWASNADAVTFTLVPAALIPTQALRMESREVGEDPANDKWSRPVRFGGGTKSGAIFGPVSPF